MFDRKKNSLQYRRLLSTGITVVMILSMIFVFNQWSSRNAEAASVLHNNANVQFRAHDSGRLSELYWTAQPGVRQTAFSGMTDYLGLVIDHEGYDHFDAANPPDDGDGIFISDFIDNDFSNVLVPAYFEENTPAKQKSYSRFSHISNDPNDINPPQSETFDVEVEQSVWTVANANWAIIQWDVINTKPTDMIDVYVGFYMALSAWVPPTDYGGLAGDSSDETDGWDAATGTLWVRDDLGTTIALSSALDGIPLDHHFVIDSDSYWPPNMGPDDSLLYTASNMNQVGGVAQDKYLLTGWNVGDIPSGYKVSLPMVIAFNTSESNVINDVLDARLFYFIETIPIMISEFQDQPTGGDPQRIEVYNEWGGDIDLAGSEFNFSTPSQPQLAGTWNPPVVPGYSHSVFEVDASTPLVVEGDIIYLDLSGLVVDEVGYGQFGTAPDPIPGQSTARIWDGARLTYSNDWTMTLATNPPPYNNTPSWGWYNIMPAIDYYPDIVLNEVSFDPSMMCTEGFIELRYIMDSGSIDFTSTNYYIIVDDVYSVVSGTVDPSAPYHYIMQSSYPAQFDMDYPGDNVYLFNSTGSLLDMAGWSTLHSPGSMMRAPEGSGTYDGYDDTSSQSAGWQFFSEPTYIDDYIEIGLDQTGGADPNTDASYNLTVTNYQAAIDYITLDHTFDIGWTLNYYTPTWIPIIDGTSGNPALLGDGLPDFSIGPTTSVMIKVNVSVPSPELLVSEFENSTVWARSFNQASACPPGVDSARLLTQVYPYLKVNKTVDPTTIWQNGAGSPDTATVNLTVTGGGVPQIVYRPQDTVFIIDRSGSMGPDIPHSDPTNIVLDAVKNYMDDMGPEDRAAVVAFGADWEMIFYEINAPVGMACVLYIPPNYYACGNWGAWLTDDQGMGYIDPNFIPRAKNPHHLTRMDAAGKTLMKTDVDTLDDFWPMGSTNIELAIQYAHKELIPGGYMPITSILDEISYFGIPYERVFPPPEGNGDPTHVWAEILLTDGLPTAHPPDRPEDWDELDAAVDNNIKIYTVGLLGPICEPSSPNYDPASCTAAKGYLEHIANYTGGKPYYAKTASDLIGIYEEIGSEIRNIAASPPQTPAITMITDVLPDYIELVPGTFNYDVGSVATNPSPCVPSQVCYIYWDINEDISIGESHWMTYDIKANIPSPPDWNITKQPEANATYTNWRGEEVTMGVPDRFITVLSPLPPELQPPFITDLQVVGAEVNMTWTLSPSTNVNAYDIYGGPTQVSIDFSAPIFSTPDEGAPAMQWWAQFPFDSVSNPEYYFVVRARNNSLPENSSTSNTAGYYTMSFSAGPNTFSLPLLPFVAQTLDWYLSNIPSATSISWLDNNDDWQTYPSTPAPQAEVGRGYVLNLTAPSSLIFTGEPGAMIKYRETWGFPLGSLVTATVVGNDIGLDWPDLGPGIEYYVYKSDTRDGFFPGSPGTFTILNGGTPVAVNTLTDLGAASVVGEDYYIIVPYDTVGGTNGSSTYSVGVFTVEYDGNEMFGLPLMRMILLEMSADWYADQISNCQGIVYLEAGVWMAHFRFFPEGIYDTTVTYGRGYELSVYDTALYSHIGW